MAVTVDDVRKALAAVKDPEIRRPITELGMVGELSVDPTGVVEPDGAADHRCLPAAGHPRPMTSPPRYGRSPASPTCG